jgi:hypothetical protein
MEKLPPVLDSGAQGTTPRMSLAGRMINVIATPGEVFEQVKTAPACTANWLAPACILIVLSWLGVWLVFSQPAIQQQLREITDQAIDKQVRSGKLTQQQAEQAREVAAKFGSLGSKLGAYGAPVFVGMVIPFWWGLFIWLVGTKAMHGDFEYMKAVEVAGLAGIIGVIDAIVRTLLILIMGSLFASPSLALFLKQFDPQNPAHTLLAVVNVMTFWVLGVRSIGLARLAGSTFSKAAAWVFGFWALETALLTGLSFGMQRLFAHRA